MRLSKPQTAAILQSKETIMPYTRAMTLNEKLDTYIKSHNLEDQGRIEEAKKLRKKVPLAPYLAKFLKDHLGKDALLNGGWNLSEAEAEYGSEFLTQ